MSDRFGIDQGDLDAAGRITLARFLESKGVPLEEIRADTTYARLAFIAWMHVFGIGEKRMPLPEAAAAANLTLEDAMTALRAVGFPDEAISSLGLADSDLPVLGMFADLLLIGPEHATGFARVVGESMARIAEAITSTVRVNLEGPMLAEGSHAEFVLVADQVTGAFLDKTGAAMDRLLRHHILALSQQTWDFDVDRAAMILPRAVGFADMVGFTPRVGASSAKELSSIIDAFEGKVSNTVVGAGGRVIKFIGDEVMFSFVDADAACRCAADLLALANDATIPDVRVGIAYGLVVGRYGDLYGPVVNTAKRLVDIAASGEVLVTPDVAANANNATFEEREPRQVKGVDVPLAHLRLAT